MHMRSTIKNRILAAGAAMIISLSASSGQAADPAFPAVGHVYKADFGGAVFRVAFDADGKTLRGAPFDAKDFEAVATTATYQATYIRPGVFLVTWQEKGGPNVAHVEDFENGTVHAALTLPDQTFLTLKGKWTRQD